MLRTFLDQLRAATEHDGDIVVEVSTPGGDAEVARRMVLEIQDAHASRDGRILFLGKTSVYSAAVTLMSAFPRADRYLARDAVLLIHCRQLDRTIEISGPMRASLPKIQAAKEQIETSLAIEEQTFRRLLDGSDIGLDELYERALHNWYLTADEALKRGLVAAIV